MNKKIALITGVTGQDGSYLAELLLKKNYIVQSLIIIIVITINFKIFKIIYKHCNLYQQKFFQCINQAN